MDTDTTNTEEPRYLQHNLQLLIGCIDRIYLTTTATTATAEERWYLAGASVVGDERKSIVPRMVNKTTAIRKPLHSLLYLFTQTRKVPISEIVVVGNNDEKRCCHQLGHYFSKHVLEGRQPLTAAAPREIRTEQQYLEHNLEMLRKYFLRHRMPGGVSMSEKAIRFFHCTIKVQQSHDGTTAADTTSSKERHTSWVMDDVALNSSKTRIEPYFIKRKTKKSYSQLTASSQSKISVHGYGQKISDGGGLLFSDAVLSGETKIELPSFVRHHHHQQNDSGNNKKRRGRKSMVEKPIENMYNELTRHQETTAFFADNDEQQQMSDFNAKYYVNVINKTHKSIFLQKNIIRLLKENNDEPGAFFAKLNDLVFEYYPQSFAKISSNRQQMLRYDYDEDNGEDQQDFRNLPYTILNVKTAARPNPKTFTNIKKICRLMMQKQQQQQHDGNHVREEQEENANVCRLAREKKRACVAAIGAKPALVGPGKRYFNWKLLNFF